LRQALQKANGRAGIIAGAAVLLEKSVVPVR
jgi:hypothetical protein